MKKILLMMILCLMMSAAVTNAFTVEVYSEGDYRTLLDTDSVESGINTDMEIHG